jgi:hypothetical protein
VGVRTVRLLLGTNVKGPECLRDEVSLLGQKVQSDSHQDLTWRDGLNVKALCGSVLQIQKGFEAFCPIRNYWLDPGFGSGSGQRWFRCQNLFYKNKNLPRNTVSKLVNCSRSGSDRIPCFWASRTWICLKKLRIRIRHILKNNMSTN